MLIKKWILKNCPSPPSFKVLKKKKGKNFSTRKLSGRIGFEASIYETNNRNCGGRKSLEGERRGTRAPRAKPFFPPAELSLYSGEWRSWLLSGRTICYRVSICNDIFQPSSRVTFLSSRRHGDFYCPTMDSHSFLDDSTWGVAALRKIYWGNRKERIFRKVGFIPFSQIFCSFYSTGF